ncbi:MAG TPA: FAD/NAD(P)-binding protein [Terriglobia bacterium]|nr:FAD/NAD(P)-binding protein [Terriglobia bacterium]
MLTAPFRVRRNRRESPDTRTLELVPMEEREIPGWRPGQFMMLYAFGVGEIPVSISGDPSRRDALTHTVRAVGSVSRAICAAKADHVIGVRGPFGAGWPDRADGRDLLFVAGGLGLAPLRPAVYAVTADRGRYGRVLLLVGARTPETLLFRADMGRWRKRGIDVQVTVDAAAPGWMGAVGPVTRLIDRAECDAGAAVAFVVGPEIMMRVAAEALERRRIGLDRVFVSMERNMHCAIGFCGHCQLGPAFICRDGPVFPYAGLKRWLEVRNL